MKKNKEFTSAQLLKSLKKAIYEMLIKTAQRDGEIVVDDGKGNPKIIKAKQALKNWDK
jgi:hypothetical protein